MFKTIENKYDEEAYEQLLARTRRCVHVSTTGFVHIRTLTIALASVSFIEETPEERVRKYKRDLKFFQALRTRVSQRYGETVDFSAIRAEGEKLIDRHVGAGS